MTSYHGGKQKIGKEIASVISPYLRNRHYCEPFCGMLGVYRHILEDVEPSRRVYQAGDMNASIIEMWKEVKDGWVPPSKCSEKTYERLKKSSQPSAKKGFIGHQYSFGGQYFKGYRGIYGNKDEYREAADNVCAIGDVIRDADVRFTHGDYTQFSHLTNYVIYCDPPYHSGSVNKNYYFDEDHNRLVFDSIAFWRWCLQMADQGNIIMISEYSCPIKNPRIRVVFEKSVKLTGASPVKRQRKEKLYMIE
jgi:site-specific DNA-adenine methylase